MINAMNYSGRGNSSGEKCTRNKGEREEEKGGKKTEGVEEEEIALSTKRRGRPPSKAANAKAAAPRFECETRGDLLSLSFVVAP